MPGRKRRRLVLVFVVGLAMVAGAAGYFYRDWVAARASEAQSLVAGWSTSLRDLAAAIPEAEIDSRAVGESRSMLVTLGSAEGGSAFALVAVSPSGIPTVIVLPQTLLLAVPGFGEFRLIDALAFEGPDLAALAVTNQFGVRIDQVVALERGAVAAAMPGPVTVDLTAPMFARGDAGIERLVPAGQSVVTPELLETLLVEAGEGDAFEFIQRQGAAWRTILEQVATDPRVADRLLAEGGGTSAADILVTVAGHDAGVVATIPVERAESVAGSGLAPVSGRADAFVAERIGHLLLRPEGRPRIEILNGNGRIGTTRVVADVLIRHGFRLVRTDNADSFEYAGTLVIAQGGEHQATAREIVELLGRGSLFLEVRAPSGVVDVSIIVGDDIPSGEG
ncbi:MAG: LCP family protein [Acidimicrobiia bacterium]